MTSDKIDLVLEYMRFSGQLSVEPKGRYGLRETDDGSIIVEWRLPETQPTKDELRDIINSAPFQNYVANRDKILDRIDARKKFDADLRRFALVIIDENNSLRDWISRFKIVIAGASSLGDLKTKVSALPDLPQRTAVNYKSLMDGKD